MTELWIVAGIAVAVGIAAAVRFVTRAPRDGGTACHFVPEGREGELAVRLAETVGCAPLRALAAVRHELDLAPGQSDEVILKRAAYHYRNSQPEREAPAYRDRVKG